MNALKKRDGVWFVYDGECPICTHAATALRIKKDYGQLYALNAREFEKRMYRYFSCHCIELSKPLRKTAGN